MRERESCEDDGREGGEGGVEEEGSLGMVSSFGVDSSVPFRPADPTRKVKHTMHYGGVNKKGGSKKREKIINKKWSYFKGFVFVQISELYFPFLPSPQTKCPCICDFNLSCKPQPGRKKDKQNN